MRIFTFAGILSCLVTAAHAAPVSLTFTTEYVSELEFGATVSDGALAPFASENSTLSGRIVFDDAVPATVSVPGVARYFTGELFIDGFGQVGDMMRVSLFDDTPDDIVSFVASGAPTGPDGESDLATMRLFFDPATLGSVDLDQVIDWTSFAASSDLLLSSAVLQQGTPLGVFEVTHRITSLEAEAVPLPAAALLFPAGLAGLVARRRRTGARH